MDENESQPEEAPFRVGNWYIDPRSGRISKQGAEVKLEPKVMSVLVFLARNQGEVISREQLEDAVWPTVVVSYDALSGAIIKLRKALGDDSRNPKYIETISKKGYRLLAKVSTESPEQQSEAADSATTGATKAARLLRTRIYLGVAFITASLIAVVLFFVSYAPDHEPDLLISTGDSDKPSLVVLPFTNLNDDPKQEYFSDGMTDDLIIDLSRYSNLQVISRRSAYIYKRRHADIQTIARELGVSYVVDGNVRRDGQNLRINVQLVDAATGLNIWAQRFDQKTQDIFGVQDQIRKSILDRLSVTLTEEEHRREQRRYTNSFDAYDLFLQGQARLVTRASAADSHAAQELMERAIQLDPDFARAHAALALIHADAFRFNWSEDSEQSRQLALKAGQRALQLDEKSPQAHWVLGYIHLFCFQQHDKAIEMASIATRLAPSDNDGYNLLGVAYAFGGQPEKGRLILEELMKRNPRYSAMVPGALGHANFLLQDYPAALAAYEESLNINPSRVNANVYKSLVLYRMGNIEEAEFQVDQLYNLHPDFNARVWAARQPFKDKNTNTALLEELVRIGVSAD
jgi:adenylate cyclase